MATRNSAIFRDYLRTLPDQLLESVSQDYVWLSGLSFDPAPAAEFQTRRECCREECLRRGAPWIFRTAEQAISPRAA
jgi:hypothetical protein